MVWESGSDQDHFSGEALRVVSNVACKLPAPNSDSPIKSHPFVKW